MPHSAESKHLAATSVIKLEPVKPHHFTRYGAQIIGWPVVTVEQISEEP
jgi:hypothetical protein